MAQEDAQIIEWSITHGVATVLLNRPRALNSLNTFMVERLSQLLDAWSRPWQRASSMQPHAAQQQQQHQQQQPDSCATAVIIKGAGGKAFCAGGDVKWVVEEAEKGSFDAPTRFFQSEYKLNYQISTLPLPYVALMDGVVMGGGAGVSVHGHFRVATERTVFAMPECGIGLYPDIGASFFLSHLPGRLGLWLGLTGARLEGIDVRAAGLATHYIPSQLLSAVEVQLQQLGAAHAASAPANSSPSSTPLDLSEVNAVLCRLEAEAGPLPEAPLMQRLSWIDRHFASFSAPAILASLGQRWQQLQQCQRSEERAEAAWLEETLAALKRGSPLSQCVTCELLRRAAHLPLLECLQLDLKLVRKFVVGLGDFAEGVRCTLIERGRAPVWKYATVLEVPDQVVQSFFDEPQDAAAAGNLQQSSRM